MKIKVIPYNTLEYASLDAFPATGESGKHYLALNTMLLYTWSSVASQYSRADFRYEGKPTYHGAYLKSGYLEYTMVASPTPIDWHNGDYIRYDRTGRIYKLYGIPQVERQASTNHSGEGFAYRNVQFYDNVKELSLVPFRDLVPGAGGIEYYFSSKQDVAFTGTVANVVERINANLTDFFGQGVWNVRIANGIPLSFEITVAKDFSVSGTCIDALNAIYETWHELGWAYAVENGANTIIIGYPNIAPSTSGNRTNIFSYGNGLNALKRNNGSMDNFCTRLHVFGTDRNLINRYYNGKDIYNAESVNIPNLMIPIELWGQTDNKPDARKAYIEDADKIALYGLITKDVYFDGTDGRPEVYPSIEQQTIELLKAAKTSLGKTGAGAPDYYPQTADDTIRVDQVKEAVLMPQDDGTPTNSGEKYVDSYDAVVASTIVNADPCANRSINQVQLFEYTFTDTGVVDVKWNGALKCVLDQPLAEGDYLLLRLCLYKGDVSRDTLVSAADFTVESNVTNGQIFNLDTLLSVGTKTNQVTGRFVVTLQYSIMLANENSRSGSNMRTVTITKEGDVVASANIREALISNFKIKTHQIGFDIAKMQSSGGATLSVKSGMCAGRDFPIIKAVYDSTNDDWTLTCKRTQDTSTQSYYPNATFPIAAGEEFVILGITMPEEYILAQAHRLSTLGQELFDRVSVFKPVFEPTIDSKKVLKNIEDHPGSDEYILIEGKYMRLYDEDLISGDHNTEVLISEITINESESEIATYHVVLSDKATVTGGSSRTVTNIATEVEKIQIQQRAQLRPETVSSDAQPTAIPDGGSVVNPIYIKNGVPEIVTGIDVPDDVIAGRGVVARGIGSMSMGGGGGNGTLTEIRIAGVRIPDVSGIVNIPLATTSNGGNGAMSYLDKTKLEGIETYAQVNRLESIKVNGVTLTITNKAVNIPVPTALSQLTDDDTHRLVTDTLIGRWNGVYNIVPSAAYNTGNELADKAFVNSSISTATATFRGTNATATTESAFLTWANALTHDLNDYVFWKTVDSVGNVVYKRYKYDGTQWVFEYDLNNSSFTSDQWAAINSGITSTLVGNYSAHIANTSNPHNVTKAQVGLGNVENTALSTWAGTSNITTLGTITTGQWQGTAIADTYIASASTWNAKYTKPNSGIPKTDLASDVQGSLDNADTAYGWGDHSQAGYASASDVSTLQGYFSNGSANTAVQLLNTRSIWGQSFDGSANVSGAMSGVTNIDTLLYFDTNNARLGVGVSNPSDKFHVGGNIIANGGVAAKGIASMSMGGTGGGGTLTQIKVNNVALADVDGVVNIPLVTTSADGVMSSSDKSKLDGIAEHANNYTLPAATSGALGGIRLGYSASGKNYPVQLDGSNKAYVNVPWENTTYSNGTGLDLSSGVFSINSTYQGYISNGNTAYGWGNHANAGYLLASTAANTYLPLSGGTISSNSVIPLILNSNSNAGHVYQQLRNNNTMKAEFGYWYDSTPSNGGVYLQGLSNGIYNTLTICDDGVLRYNNNTVWHAGNDGSGSGLDADLLDGEHASAFAHVGQWNNLLTSGNEFNFISNGFTGGVWFNYQDGNRQSQSNVTGYIFGNGQGGYSYLYTLGIVRPGVDSSSHVFTTNGGHAAISDLSVNYATSAGYVDKTDTGNWDADSPDTNSYLWFYGQGGGVTHFPHSMVGTYGSVATFFSGGTSQSLHAQLAWGINHDSSSVSHGIAWRAKNNLGWDATWHRLYDDNYHPTADNADTVDSLHAHTGRNNEANKLVRTDASGYIQCGYINSSNGDEGNNSSPVRVWGTNGSDSYLRTYNASYVSVGYANKLVISNLATDTDINDIVECGSYGNQSTNDCYSFLNGPTGRLNGEMRLDVFGTAQGSNSYNFQQYYAAAGTSFGVYLRYHTSGSNYGSWREYAFTDSNVASATQLQTSRSIWGQSFNGTRDVSGNMTGVGNITMSGIISMNSEYQVQWNNGSTWIYGDSTSVYLKGNVETSGNLRVYNASNNQTIAKFVNYASAPYGLIMKSYTTGAFHLQAQRENDNSETFPLLLNPNGGNVGIGTTSPSYKLHVAGDIYANGGWLRTSGAAGWYSETYGGGWYCDDYTYVKTYGSRSIYTANNVLAGGNIVANGGVAAKGIASMSMNGGGGAAGAVTQINVGSTPYTPTDGIVTLPSSYPASDVSAWAKASTRPAYNTSIATSSGTNQRTLEQNTKYALSAGDTSYIFTTPKTEVTFSTTTLTSSSTSVYLDNTINGPTFQKVVINSANNNQQFTINLKGSGSHYGHRRQVLIYNNSGRSISVMLAGANYIDMSAYFHATSGGIQTILGNPIDMDDGGNHSYLLDITEPSANGNPIVTVHWMNTYAD